MTNKLTAFFDQFLETPRDQLQGESIDDQTKLAAAIIMSEMARDRSEYDSSYHQVFVAELINLFNLSEGDATMLEKHADLADAVATSLYPFTHLLNKDFDYSQKLDLIKALWSAANQVHGIDREEDIYIHKVAELLHVSYRGLMKIKPR